MRAKATHVGFILLACASLFLSAPGFTPDMHAQTYFIQSQGGVPMPYDPYDGAEPIVTVDASKQIYRVQDNTNDWEMLTTARELDMMSASSSTMSADSIDPGGTNDSGGGTYTNYGNFQPSIVFGSNDLWIEITNVDIINQQASLILHGTVPDEHYQLLSSNVLSGNGEAWTLGEYITGWADTNVSLFSVVNIDTNSQMFYRAHHANPVLAITASQPAIQPNPTTGDPGQAGSFLIQSYYSLSNDLTVHYDIGGTAVNGVDYSNLTGVVTIPAGLNPTNITVVPFDHNRMQGDKTVVLTIQQTNSYLIDPNARSASISILDSFTVLSLFQDTNSAYRPNGPSGVPAQAGDVVFSRFDQQNEYPEITVAYSISGTASNGVDYSLLSGSFVFPDGVSSASLGIIPLSENTIQGIKTVTVTLVPTNSYFINPDTNYDSQTVQIFDSSTTVTITQGPDATETNSSTGAGPDGFFTVSRSDDRNLLPPLTVNLKISGTASNGVDYQTVANTITFANGEGSTNIDIKTIEDSLIEGDETVTITLVTNGNSYYLGDPTNATITIHDTIGFLTVASGFNGVIGIDYYAPSNCLIVSENYNDSGVPFNFARVNTNIVVSGGNPATNVVVTNWSGITGLGEEVYLVAPRIPIGAATNSAGFTNGDLFFSSDTGIGWLSAGATRSNLDWCILTNSFETNGLLLRGGICIDQTGTFSNHLIAVTSGNNDFGIKGVWSIDAKAHPTLIAQINTLHLEGVTTLTNDTQKWGPWAGKIITGDENSGSIFTISTNGTVTTYDTTTFSSNGIAVEDFDVIPANSPLYITAFNNDSIMELPASYFTNNVGDLLITQAGEIGLPPGLFIVHWNAQGSNFITTSIPVPDTVGGHIEGVTFAPIRMPGH